jgi:hypothetical protein
MSLRRYLSALQLWGNQAKTREHEVDIDARGQKETDLHPLLTFAVRENADFNQAKPNQMRQLK